MFSNSHMPWASSPAAPRISGPFQVSEKAALSSSYFKDDLRGSSGAAPVSENAAIFRSYVDEDPSGATFPALTVSSITLPAISPKRRSPSPSRVHPSASFRSSRSPLWCPTPQPESYLRTRLEPDETIGNARSQERALPAVPSSLSLLGSSVPTYFARATPANTISQSAEQSASTSPSKGAYSSVDSFAGSTWLGDTSIEGVTNAGFNYPSPRCGSVSCRFCRPTDSHHESQYFASRGFFCPRYSPARLTSTDHRSTPPSLDEFQATGAVNKTVEKSPLSLEMKPGSLYSYSARTGRFSASSNRSGISSPLPGWQSFPGLCQSPDLNNRASSTDPTLLKPSFKTMVDGPPRRDPATVDAPHDPQPQIQELHAAEDKASQNLRISPMHSTPPVSSITPVGASEESTGQSASKQFSLHIAVKHGDKTHMFNAADEKRNLKDQLRDIKVCAEYLETREPSSLDIKDLVDLLKLQRTVHKQRKEKRRAKKELRRQKKEHLTKEPTSKVDQPAQGTSSPYEALYERFDPGKRASS